MGVSGGASSHIAAADLFHQRSLVEFITLLYMLSRVCSGTKGKLGRRESGCRSY